MIVVSTGWMVRGGDKLKRPEPGLSLECAENSLASLGYREQSEMNFSVRSVLGGISLGFKRFAKS